MSVKIVFIILGIIFYVVKQLSKGNENQNSGKAKNAPRPANTQKSTSQKSIDDIFNEFVKEVESVKKKEVKPVVSAPKKVASKQNLDWQQVDKSNIKPKKQLIDHEDYHYVSHRVDKAHQIENMPEIQESEGQVVELDLENIDWHKAVVYKEILDRKYA